MDFIDQLQIFAAQIERILPNISTEESTKHSLVLPFLNIMGYNVFDPTEIVPEFTADVGIKKGEKVDYAIFQDGKPTILIECKSHTCNLDEQHANQLFRYFGTTPAKFGILTNGIIYRFFTDIEEANKMDQKPFFEFNILDVKDIDTLKKFTKTGYSAEDNFSAAIELKYTREIKKLIASELTAPSDQFVKLFAKQVHPGHITPAKLAQFTDITKRAYHQLISDKISERLQTAMQQESASSSQSEPQTDDASEIEATDNRDIITTDEEKEAYFIIRTILHELADVKRIALRDAKTYCSILFDDNNRKPICRLYFNSANKQIAFLTPQHKEERHHITDVDDIYNFTDQLKEIVGSYLGLTAAG